MNRIVLLILLSTQVIAQKALVANFCESMFLPQFKSFFLQNNFGAYKVSYLDRINDIASIRNVRSRVGQLERFENNINVYYSNEVRPINKKIKDARDSNMSKEFIDNLEKQKEKISLEYIDESNALIDVAYKSFMQKKIPVELRVRDVKGTKKKVHYLEFYSTDLKISNEAFTTTNRLKETFDVKQLTIDIFGNMKLQSGGFFNESSSRVELGFKAIRDILIRDTPGRVVKHEFMHAAFSHRRSLKQDSIYNATYTSYKNKNISKEGIYYERFMSAEELYTFTNQPFWAVELFRVKKNASVYDYMEDLSKVVEKISMNSDIIKQTADISAATVKHLEGIMLSNKKLVKSMDFYNKDYAIAINADEVDQIFFKIKKREVRYSDSVNSEGFKEDLRILYDKKVKVYDVITNKYKDIGKKELRLKVNKLLAEDSDYIESSKNIISKLIKKQKTLNRVATKVDELNELVVNQSDDLISYIRMRNGLEPTYPASSELKGKLEDLRRSYRRLAMSTRENYKGFLGKL